MNSYLAFYRLHVQGNDDEELDAAIEALHASLGIENGALAYFFDHVHHLLALPQRRPLAVGARYAVAIAEGPIAIVPVCASPGRVRDR
jgi:hypothetical protein